MTTSIPDTPDHVPPLEARAVDVHIHADRMVLRLADGREISVPLAWFPRQKPAADAERAGGRLMGNGEGIHWEAIDEDISVPVLLGLPCD